MTREEAIQWLTDIKENITENWSHDVAIDMAIESLSADTVSREQYQGLLNAIGKVYVEVVWCKDCRFAEHREQMPNQVYCKRDKLSAFCSPHDDDDFCKYGERSKTNDKGRSNRATNRMA